MNVIVVVIDTLRRDHLGCYGSKTVLTPNLDRLAEEAVVFDGCYSGGFPTLPCRAELLTGRFTWPYLDWGPLPSRETPLAEVMAAAGYHCALFTDNLHLARTGYGYDRGYHTRVHVRGQWYDPYIVGNEEMGRAPFRAAGDDGPAISSLPHFPISSPAISPFPNFPPEKVGQPERLAQYCRNVAHRQGEEDYFPAQVFGQAARWLAEQGRRAPFFLHVDVFDPHEPWDPPPHYRALYEPGCDGPPVMLPVMGPAGRYSAEEMRHLRALYAGEVTLVDAWFGRLLKAVDDLGLREETALFVLSDHGVLLGERGLIGKMGKTVSHEVKGWPLWPELTHVPLLARVPGIRAGRAAGFCHPGDVMPTVLQAAAVAQPQRVRARSLAPLLADGAAEIRDVAISSWSLRDGSRSRPSVLRTRDWAFHFWRTGVRPALFHRPSDPAEEVDVLAGHPAVARELHGRYLRFLRDHQAPAKNYWPRRFLTGVGSEPARPERR